MRIEREVRPGARPRATVIIPTRDGARAGRLARLREDLERQTFQDFEVIVVAGDPRQGRAINRAARLAAGRILITLDDDTRLESPQVFARLVDALDGDPSIGIAGASTLPPAGASRFQRAASRQIPRRLFPVLDRTTDSDMAQHPCMAIRRDVFEAAGGEDEDLVRGLDPLLRHRVREAGYRVVIAARAWACHPLPEGLGALLRMSYRNGRGSAFAQRRFPDRVYELSDGRRRNRFAPKRPLAYRAARHAARLLGSILRLRAIGIAAQIAYALGFLREYFARSGPAPIMAASCAAPPPCCSSPAPSGRRPGSSTAS